MKKVSSAFLILPAIFLGFAIIWILVGNFSLNFKTTNESENKMTFESVTVNLMVENVNETIEFYEKNFGFKVTETVPDSGDYVFATVKADSVQLMLLKKEVVASDLPSIKGKDTGGTFTLFFVVSDIKEVYKKATKNCELIKDLEDMFYGMREFTVKENNGYIFTFAQRIETN